MPVMLDRFHEIEPRAPLGGRMLRALSILAGVFGLAIFVTAPMDAEQQAVLTLIGIAGFILISRFNPTRKTSLVLVVMSVAITTRYLFWRFTETLVFEEFWQGVRAVRG